jgi:hypothetical protein
MVGVPVTSEHVKIAIEMRQYDIPQAIVQLPGHLPEGWVAAILDFIMKTKNEDFAIESQKLALAVAISPRLVPNVRQMLSQTPA